MCVEPLHQNILNERTFDARDRFADVFDLLLQLRDTANNNDNSLHTECDNVVATALQTQIDADAQKLAALPRHDQYSRHVIGTDGEWMGFICRWDANAASVVHGHPSFAYYQVIGGQFLMDLYEPTCEKTAKWVDAKTLKKGDCIWQQGTVGQYDNLVHKVSNENQDGYTLHLFSENPCLGRHY